MLLYHPFKKKQVYSQFVKKFKDNVTVPKGELLQDNFSTACILALIQLCIISALL